MNNDIYVQSVLINHSPALNLNSGLTVVNSLAPTLQQWANGYLDNLHLSGSLAKGTAISGTSDVDILISMTSNTQENLQQLHNLLFTWFNQNGFNPRSQNVAVNINLNGLKVDLVPAKRQDLFSNDHSIWLNKQNTWQKTNIHNHITHVGNSGRTNEIRAIKIWRKLHGLDFPSFPLEITVIQALQGKRYDTLSSNVVDVWRYIAQRMNSVRLADPSNTNNFLDNELTTQEKQSLVTAANNALASPWNQVIW